MKGMEFALPWLELRLAGRVAGNEQTRWASALVQERTGDHYKGFRGRERGAGGGVQGGSNPLHQLLREEEREGVVQRCAQSLMSSIHLRETRGFLQQCRRSPGIPSFPDIPGDSSDDSSFLIVSALSCPKISKGGGPPSVEIREEGARDFPGAGTEKQHVIRIFILGAG
jgi:hypothetical protein